jgi:hypothetical protein
MEERTERAVLAAAEALHKAVCFNVPCPHQTDSFLAKARICVEAAAPILTVIPNDVADLANQGLLAEVEALRALRPGVNPLADQLIEENARLRRERNGLGEEVEVLRRMVADKVRQMMAEVLENPEAAAAYMAQKARIDARVAEKRAEPCPIEGPHECDRTTHL